jgi:DNA polymerase-3 subunit beta
MRFNVNNKILLAHDTGDEYPQAKPLSDGATRITIPAERLLRGINRTLLATSNDVLRPALNGIYLDVSDSNIVFVASDGHKLVRFKDFSVKGNEKTSFILPKKQANLLRTVLPKETGTVDVCFDENNAYIQMGKMEIIYRLIEGKYPDYNDVIPKGNPYKVVVDRLPFINALKQVIPDLKETSVLVELCVYRNTIVISTQAIDYSTSAKEKVACVYDGEPIIICFNGVNLIQILNNIQSSAVVLNLSDYRHPRAGLVLPAENEENEDMLMLLMPKIR